MLLLFEELVEIAAAVSESAVEEADADVELDEARSEARAASPAKPTGPCLSMPALRCGAPRLTMVRKPAGGRVQRGETTT